jgi:hypothetical protein
MAISDVEPAKQVRQVARLLGSAAIRLKRRRTQERVEKSRDDGPSALEIARKPVITVSRGNDLATGETGPSQKTISTGDSIERETTRTDREAVGPRHPAGFRETVENERTSRTDAIEQRGGDQ